MFSPNGTLTSASAAPHCGVGRGGGQADGNTVSGLTDRETSYTEHVDGKTVNRLNDRETTYPEQVHGNTVSGSTDRETPYTKQADGNIASTVTDRDPTLNRLMGRTCEECD